MDYHQSLKDYVNRVLSQKVTPVTAPEIINLISDYTEFCVSTGVKPKLLADEFVEKQASSLVMLVSEYVSGWHGLGIPAPIAFVGKSGSSVVTYRHKAFEKLTGIAPLNASFGGIFEWVCAQVERDFLLACALQLRAMGVTSILVSDTSGDAGIDMIGFYERGPLAGKAIFVQAKSSINNEITRDLLYSEFGKYWAGRNGEKGREYFNAIGANRSAFGVAPIFCFMTNSDFKEGARKAARELGILLKSARQIAHDLSRDWNRGKIEHLQMTVGPLKTNLKENILPKLNEYV